MGNTGLGLNLPGVEKAMLEMEGSGLTGEDLKEKFARLGRRVCDIYLRTQKREMGDSILTLRNLRRLDHCHLRVHHRPEHLVPQPSQMKLCITS
jgi:hypothetical protein